MAGGYPGNTAVGLIARGTGILEDFAQGTVPTGIDALRGEHELQPCYGQTHVAPGDLLYVNWQSGGGYGDPLLREPDLVAHDLAEGKISAAGARDSYGVVIEDGVVDTAATESLRGSMREERRRRSTPPETEGRSHDVSAARRIDDNLVVVDSDGADVVACAHCGHELGDRRTGPSLQLAFFQGETSLAGTQVTAHPADYVDDEVVFRQLSCPGCYTAVYSGVVPAAHTDHVLALDRYVSA